jgi:uncharacterized protein (DUF2336 family)
MPNQRGERTLTIADEDYTVLFTWTALADAEQMLGVKTPMLPIVLASGSYGFREVLALTTAGLEGARRKLNMGGRPWTPQKVGEVLEDADSLESVASVVAEALDEAVRRWFPADEEAGEDPKASTGTTPSGEPSAQESAPTTSGT